MRPYIIKQGDYLSKLASLLRFDAQSIWNDPRNQELKKRRADPEILLPGDVLYIPDAPPAPCLLRKGTKNRFVAAVTKVRVRTCFRDHEGSPFKALQYKVEGLGEPITGVTDVNGLVDFDVDVGVREVRVVFPDRLEHYDLRIGDLDPIDEPTGANMRLEHLGYYGWMLAGRAEPSLGLDTECLRLALRAFQRDRKLPETGMLDAATTSALREAHGV